MRHIFVLLLALVGCGGSTPSGIHRLDHIVIIYLENHSFDNLYGEFTGAENLASAAHALPQVDGNGSIYAALPPVIDTATKMPDPRFPRTFANQPFAIGLDPSQKTGDIVHRFYQEQAQIDSGRMDRFVEISDAKSLVMGYWHTAQLPLAGEAVKYTLCDHFFHASFGGSFLNHQWLIAASSPTFPSAPASVKAMVDASGLPRPGQDNFVTADGFVVNTAYSVNQPHPPNSKYEQLVPQQTAPTIGDRLSAAQVSWAWYAGGWNDALAGRADPEFQFHHQPFVYYRSFADGTRAKQEHLKDEADFTQAASSGALPAVAFVKPIGENNEHPGYADILDSERHTEQLIDAVRTGPSWSSTAIIITYDENGGQWDHVAPPRRDRWGPGTRVPTLVISPFARRGYVDSTSYDTTSILALIEHRFGLEPLGTADAAAADLSAAFEF